MYHAMALIFTLLCLEAGAGQTFMKPELHARVVHDKVPLGFPIAVEFTFKNVDKNSIWVTESSGCFMWASLNCIGEGVKLRPPKQLNIFDAFISVSASAKEVSSQSVKRYVQYIDPKWIVTGPGKIAIQYRASSQCYEIADRTLGPNVPHQYWEGQVELEVEHRRVTEDDVKRLIELWDGTSDRADAVQEGLSYIEEPYVIPYVVRLARENPYATYHAFVGLEKFANTEKGRNALEAIAEEFKDEDRFQSYLGLDRKENYGCDNLKNMFIVFERTSTQPTREFINKQLQCKYQGRVWSTLDYLLRADAQKLADVEHLKKLISSENEGIQKQAKKILEKLPPPEPRVDF